MDDEIRPPSHLAAPTKRWFMQICETYELESHHLRLLTLACEAWDRGQQARKRIAEDGAVVPNRWGELRPHPSVGIERDAQTMFARLVRELNLDSAPDESRPPRISARRGAA